MQWLPRSGKFVNKANELTCEQSKVYNRLCIRYLCSPTESVTLTIKFPTRIKRNSTTYVGDSIVRKTNTRLNKGEDVVVCLPGPRIEHVTERVEKIMGRGKGGSILVHVGTNNADKEGTTAIVNKYRNLLKKTKEARVGQIILSGILPVFCNRIDGYLNLKRMAINGMMKRLCGEEDVGYVDLWDSFVGKEEMYARDGLHLSGKGAAAFAERLSGAVASGLGKVRYLN